MTKVEPTPLAKYRAARNETLDDLGRVFSVDKATISRWERGKVRIPITRVAEIEALTGIPREQLRPDVFRAAV